jgi:hypothetical protein
MAEPNTTSNQSNAFLEWMRPFINDKQKDANLEDQLDLFKIENLSHDAQQPINPS